MVGGVNDGDHRIDRMDILDHALEAIRTFEPVTPAQVAALLARAAGPGAEGAYELLVNGAGIRVDERRAGERQRRIVMMKMTASSRIMTAMKNPENVRKPETLALTPPMSDFSSSSCWRRLDVST